MPTQVLTPTLGQMVTVDPSPLKIEATLSLWQALNAMTAAAKSYALVSCAQTPTGIFTYEHVTQAIADGANFEKTTLGDWMTPLDRLRPSFDIHIEGEPSPAYLTGAPGLPVVNSSGHWVGLLTPEGVYTLPNEAEFCHGCLIHLNHCHQTSAALVAHQNHLTLALKGARMGTLDWDLATQTVTVSEELETLLGMAPGEFEGDFHSLFKHVHTEDREYVYQALQQALHHRQRYAIDFRVTQPNGTVRWLLSQGQGFGDSALTSRLAGVTLDISAQKQAETELILQAQRERLVGEIAQRIRTLLDLDSILQQTVISVREFIEADRVIILQCTADMSGKVIQESCAPDYPAMMGWEVRDPWSVDEKFLAHYRQGRGLGVANIYEQGLSKDQLLFLEYFRIQAEVVVPLLQEDTLWGLL
ncbi:MAG: PAS domain-containing protein, partial [Leptolyngbyaceae cyanobacterium SM2_5_2]|nr:PAS domain-containing protein [Leptolyngbyaceae cyanobacterium SM2_5_2]